MFSREATPRRRLVEYFEAKGNAEGLTAPFAKQVQLFARKISDARTRYSRSPG